MWENEQNSPYVARPGGGSDEKRYDSVMLPNPMARAAYTTGIIAVVSLVTMLIYPAIVLGATAIILALLSRDRAGRMHAKAKNAVTAGVVAIIADAVVIGAVFILLFSNGPFKQQLNDTFRQIYGQTFDDMWEDIRDGSLDLEYRNLPYGINPDGISPEGISPDGGLNNDKDVSYNISSDIV